MEAKLSLVEFLLASSDLQVSARRAVDWLAAHAGVEQAIVAIAEPGTAPLLLVAEHGVSSAAIVEFVLTRDDQEHPLIRALDRRQPSYFAGPFHPFRTPLEGRAFHAVPLRGPDDPTAHGLLLADGAGARVAPGRRLGRRASSAGSCRGSLSRDRLGATTRRRRADAALQHHQRRHRPDSADRHRRQADHRQRARREAVRRARGCQRGLAPARSR